jgi:DNA-binding SARP family transcriptional activator
MTLQLNVLGGLSLCRGDQPMAGAAAQRKPLALLAVIERAGARGISRERLLSLFAPESDEERARGVLKQLLYALRKDSGEATLVDGVATLILNSEIVQCDLRQFEAHCAAGAWQQAVEAYGGPFLDGIHLAGAPEFEEWADQHRRVAAGLYRKALLERAQAEDLAVPGGGEWWWSRLSGLDPLDFPLAMQLHTDPLWHSYRDDPIFRAAIGQ